MIVYISLPSGSCDAESERPHVTGRKSTVAHAVAGLNCWILNSNFTCARKLDLLLNFRAFVCVVALQACPEEVISIDNIRAAMGVGLVPNTQRQKLEEKAAADEKKAPEPLGENFLGISTVY